MIFDFIAGVVQAVLSPLATILIFIGILTPVTDFTNTKYEGKDGTTLYAYAAFPPNYNSSLSYPTALVFHDWNGLDDETYFVDLLANEGIVALAPDLFRGVVSPMLFLPWNILQSSTVSQDRIDDDVDVAIEYLLSSTAVNDTLEIRSGPGFCFGGSQALELSARRQMGDTITLYGSSISELQRADSGNWGYIGSNGMRVLGIYGSLDTGPSPREAKGFQKAMEKRGINHTVTIYEDQAHGFVNTGHEDGKKAAVEAWDQVIAFISEGSKASVKSLTAVQEDVHGARVNTRGPNARFLFDHLIDPFRSEGHQGHKH